MALKYNPLLTGKLDLQTVNLKDLADVNTAGTADGKILSYQAGTWVARGTVITEQIPNLPTSKITSGTFSANRIETLDNIKGTVTAAKVAALDADKITSGTFSLARVPTMDDAHIPNLDTLSGGAFGTAQIPSIGAYKISSGSFNADRIPALPTARITSGTFDDARIPDTGVVAINYVIDGGGAAIGTGIKGDLEVPFACHVNRWTLLADQHGSIVVDVWRDSYANFPPTDADSMPGTTNMPAISGTVAAQCTNLSGWGTQGIASGDILRYNVDSCTLIERCTLALKTVKV